MSEACNTCKQAVICENLTKELDSLKEEVESLKDKLGELATAQAVNEEQTKMVFKILTEIKDSIKLISDKIDILEKKPSKNWDETVKVVITVVVTAAITYFIKK